MQDHYWESVSWLYKNKRSVGQYYSLDRISSFAVMAILLLLLDGIGFIVMPKDIPSSVDIPVVSLIWSYTGLAA